jgi:ATP-dependent DNA ligase
MMTCAKGVLPVLYKATATGAVQEWEIWVEPSAAGGIMVTRYGLQGHKMQTVREEIAKGKNLGKKSATTAFEQACLEARARWEKQLNRKGYGLDAAESRLARAESPMLAQVYDKHARKVRWNSAFAQPKLDGFRCLVRRDDKGRLRAFSRENQLLNVPHVLDALEKARVVDHSIGLDGELYSHEMPLNKVASACKKLSDLTYRLGYHVYDLTTSDEDYEARYTDLFGLLGDSLSAQGISLVETIKVRSEQELMACQARFIGQGYEGAMLRHGPAGYEPGERSDSLLKVKTFLDREFEVVDYKTGRGKYQGTPIFTCVTEEGNHFEVLAPGTLEQKKALGEKADECVGRRLTVKFAGFTKTEEPVPFHPVAVGFRD